SPPAQRTAAPKRTSKSACLANAFKEKLRYCQRLDGTAYPWAFERLTPNGFIAPLLLLLCLIQLLPDQVAACRRNVLEHKESDSYIVLPRSKLRSIAVQDVSTDDVMVLLLAMPTIFIMIAAVAVYWEMRQSTPRFL
ncbi:hypothetical protein BOX15_Mlig005478g1, partial [Macrostomum lignano]